MQHQVPIVLTGLPADDCSAFAVACADAGCSWAHRPAAEMLAMPAEPPADVQPWVFWLYRAPWHVLAGAACADAWLALHRQLLRQRQDFGARLVMINVDAEQPHRVLQVLGLLDAAIPALPVEPEVSSAGASLSTLLAKVFDWAAPEYWDVFEALEAAAPDTGRLPMFRSMLHVPAADQVLELRSLVVAGGQMPAQQSALASTQEALLSSNADREELRRKVDRLTGDLLEAAGLVESLRLDMRDQGSAAALQIEGMQSELAARDQMVDEGRVLQEQMRGDLQVAGEALSDARQRCEAWSAAVRSLEDEKEALRLRSEQLTLDLDRLSQTHRQQALDAERAQAELAGQVDGLRAQEVQQAQLIDSGARALAAAVEAAQSSRNELDRLKPELAAMQAKCQKLESELVARDGEVEQWRNTAAKAQAESATQLHLIKQVKAVQQQLETDLQASARALAAARQQANQALVKSSDLEGEKQLLLLQMHQVQEELETHLLDKRQLAAHLENAKAEAAAEVASLRSELKQQAGQLSAREASLAREAEAGQVLRSELGRLQAALVTAQAQGQNLAAELKLRDESLKQASVATAALRTEIEVAQASLKQAEAAQQQLLKDLQARAATLTATEREVEEGRSKGAALASENQLLLLQLHQVQEDLERGFLESRQLRQFAVESRTSMDRARALVSRLMLAGSSQPGMPVSPLKHVDGAA